MRGLAPLHLYFYVTITLEPNCPRCGSHSIRPSRQSSLLTAVLRQVLLDPYRCRSCFRRFYRLRSMSVPSLNPASQAVKSRAAAN